MNAISVKSPGRVISSNRFREARTKITNHGRFVKNAIIKQGTGHPASRRNALHNNRDKKIIAVQNPDRKYKVK